MKLQLELLSPVWLRQFHFLKSLADWGTQKLADVEKVCSEVQRKASVKKRFTLSRDTNGPYKVTVQKKTKDSLLLRNGLNRLIKNISFIYLLFVDQSWAFNSSVNAGGSSHFSHFKHAIQCFELRPGHWNHSETIAWKNYKVGCTLRY